MEAREHRAHQPRRLGQLGGPQHLVDQCAHELLLASDAGEVRIGLHGRLCRAHVRERLSAVQVLTSRQHVEPGVGIGDMSDLGVADAHESSRGVRRLEVARRVHVVRRDAHVDAAELVDCLLEPIQVDVQVVVDRDVGQREHRVRHQLGPAVLHSTFERRVNLVRAVARDVHPEVPRERQHDGLAGVGIEVHEHDRVGPRGPTEVLVRSELALLTRGQTRP